MGKIDELKERLRAGVNKAAAAAQEKIKQEQPKKVHKCPEKPTKYLCGHEINWHNFTCRACNRCRAEARKAKREAKKAAKMAAQPVHAGDLPRPPKPHKICEICQERIRRARHRLPAGVSLQLTWDGAEWSGRLLLASLPGGSVEATSDTQVGLCRALDRAWQDAIFPAGQRPYELPWKQIAETTDSPESEVTL